jgi:hypothetical protein
MSLIEAAANVAVGYAAASRCRSRCSRIGTIVSLFSG